MQFIKKGDIIALGCDHGGYQLCNIIEEYVKEQGIEVIRYGCTDGQAIDYPEVAVKVCNSIVGGESKCGILVCGTGIGISIAANKIDGIRCGLCPSKEIAALVKQHNNANVLALGGRTTETGLAMQIVDAWLDTEFEGGRHQRRVDMLDQM